MGNDPRWVDKEGFDCLALARKARWQMKREGSYLCPSAPASATGAHVIGIVEGTPDQPLVSYLSTPLPIENSAIASILPANLNPTEFLRLSAPCQGGCLHFSESRCRLVDRLVSILPSVVSEVPACVIRVDCRWFHQHGKQACLRCPQVVTENYRASEAMNQVSAIVSVFNGVDPTVVSPRAI